MSWSVFSLGSISCLRVSHSDWDKDGELIESANHYLVGKGDYNNPRLARNVPKVTSLGGSCRRAYKRVSRVYLRILTDRVAYLITKNGDLDSYNDSGHGFALRVHPGNPARSGV